VLSSAEELPDLMLGVANANATTSTMIAEQMMPRRTLPIEGNDSKASQFRALVSLQKIIRLSRASGT
jgi:hypothetical protein